MDKLFPKEFFDIQISFATKMSTIKNVTLEETLFAYTSLPVRFGIPFSELTEDHPVCQEYLREIKSGNISDISYQFYQKREKDLVSKQIQFSDRVIFGCFSYNLHPGGKSILLHFANNDTPEPGFLSEQRIPVRLDELKNMFSDIKSKYPDFKFVISSSWLFNIEAFTRLFPPEFISSKQIKTDYHSMGMWGQFMNKYGGVKEDLAKQFIGRLSKATTFEELEQSFPLKELKITADLNCFYDMYKI